jgi:hypothetical protein
MNMASVSAMWEAMRVLQPGEFMRFTGHAAGEIVACVDQVPITRGRRGVETQEQLSTLLELQCPYVQEYVFSRPRPIDEVADLIERLPFAIAHDASL